MTLQKIIFKTVTALQEHIKSHKPTFYFSSQTSTVIPYDKLKSLFKDDNILMGDLSQLPSSMELKENGNLIVRGPVSWKDARDFLQPKGRNIQTAPTEELALISAGAATSATGERCFALGSLRSQIERIKYLNFDGIEIELCADKKLEEDFSLTEYQKDYSKYQMLKNAPFPRFEMETDLMIGTEGQLGVISEIEIKTCKNFNVQYLFMLLPKWEDDLSAHIELNKKIQTSRDTVILCEFIDSNSFAYLPEGERPNQNMDAVFFEIRSEAFESFYEDFLLSLSFLNDELVFEMTQSKFHTLRASIPRAVFEANSHMRVTKMGTDVQVQSKDFLELMSWYQEFSKSGIPYNLFGHFGDSHLHFNFMPRPEQLNQCSDYFIDMYRKVAKISGSPFAEHGIGILKQKYIKEFWNQNQVQTFKNMKNKYDPFNQFFPQGFMNLES